MAFCYPLLIVTESFIVWVYENINIKILSNEWCCKISVLMAIEWPTSTYIVENSFKWITSIAVPKFKVITMFYSFFSSEQMKLMEKLNRNPCHSTT